MCGISVDGVDVWKTGGGEGMHHSRGVPAWQQSSITSVPHTCRAEGQAEQGSPGHMQMQGCPGRVDGLRWTAITYKMYELCRVGRDGLLEAAVAVAKVHGGTQVPVQLAVRLGGDHVVLALILTE